MSESSWPSIYLSSQQRQRLRDRCHCRLSLSLLIQLHKSTQAYKFWEKVGAFVAYKRPSATKKRAHFGGQRPLFVSRHTVVVLVSQDWRIDSERDNKKGAVSFPPPPPPHSKERIRRTDWLRTSVSRLREWLGGGFVFKPRKQQRTQTTCFAKRAGFKQRHSWRRLATSLPKRRFVKSKC